MQRKPDIPNIYFLNKSSDDEVVEARVLSSIVLRMHKEVSMFYSIMHLADLSFAQMASVHRDLLSGHESGQAHSPIERIGVFGDWGIVAAHGVIDRLYQFAECLDEAMEWSDRASLTKRFHSSDVFPKANELFNRNFPKWEQTRHAVAHSAEIIRKADKNYHKAPLTKGPISKEKGSSIIMQNSYDGRTFITTRRGELLRLDITWDSYVKILEVYEFVIKGVGGK
ncbi:hypothetical protein [Roseibium litorale]|uniref:Uncharacterized protein n=1 Tax=Roseibium litorale TaxID=2803841 RepID=A0ABR9CJB9_9HYPH|nr:hypothetical protein [Roseibium litorale]MBD8890933.1 hypothetical protein [Roseibium litorale]